jgi:hypothetical protein
MKRLPKIANPTAAKNKPRHGVAPGLGPSRRDGFLLLTIRPSGKCKVAQPPTARCSFAGNVTKERAPTEADAHKINYWGLRACRRALAVAKPKNCLCRERARCRVVLPGGVDVNVPRQSPVFPYGRLGCLGSCPVVSTSMAGGTFVRSCHSARFLFNDKAHEPGWVV